MGKPHICKEKHVPCIQQQENIHQETVLQENIHCHIQEQENLHQETVLQENIHCHIKQENIHHLHTIARSNFNFSKDNTLRYNLLVWLFVAKTLLVLHTPWRGQQEESDIYKKAFIVAPIRPNQLSYPSLVWSRRNSWLTLYELRIEASSSLCSCWALACFVSSLWEKSNRRDVP